MQQQKKQSARFLSIFWKFFKIGLFTFGGGFAMIPLIEREVVENGWITQEDVNDLVAIAQSIPGAVAVNMSLFVGYRIHKVRGAIVAVLGCISPSILVILTIAMFFSQFQDLEIVQHAFTGVLSAVVALILIAAYRMAKMAIMDIPTLLITIVTLIGLIFLPKVNAIYYIIGGAAVGTLFYYVYPKKVRQLMKKGEEKHD